MSSVPRRVAHTTFIALFNSNKRLPNVSVFPTRHKIGPAQGLLSRSDIQNTSRSMNEEAKALFEGLVTGVHSKKRAAG